MSGILEKAFDSIGSLFSPLGTSVGLKHLLERCLAAQTKGEEEWLVNDCLRIVKAKLLEPSNKPSSISRCLAFVIFSEMMGYKAEFSYIHAVKLAQFGSLSEKKMGYLASVFLLRESHPLSVMLVNTIVRDLASRNIIVVAMALSASCYIIPSNQAPTILPLLADKLNHPSEFVRSKAVIVLHHFLRLCPEQCCHYIDRVRALLGDRDPGVVALVLQFLLDAVQTTPGLVAELAPVLVQIQRQILEGKLPHEYTYRGLHAPWMQISVLRLLQQLKEHNTSIEALVYETLLAAKVGHEEAIGAALISECISTLVHLKQSDDMLALAMAHISSFVASKSQNLRYAGLCLLEVILLRYHLMLSPEQQQVVLSSLQHPDHAVKRKTLSLLCAAASEKNVEAICTQVADYAQDHCSDNPHLQSELVNRAIQLTDKFPNIKDCWHIAMLIRLLPLSNQIQSKLVQRRIKLSLLSDQDHDLTAARHKVLKILKKYSESKTASTSVLEVYVWALSQFELIVVDNGIQNATPVAIMQEIIELGQKVLRYQQPESSLHYGIQELLLSIVHALTHIIEHHGTFSDSLLPYLNSIKIVSVGDSYLHECCSELLYLLPQSQAVCECLKQMDDSGDSLDFTMSFLDGFVCESLRKGEQPYQPKLPKAIIMESSISSLGAENLDLPATPSSPVSSERGSLVGSFSSEDLKSWPLTSLKQGPNISKSVWTKEGRVKDSEHMSHEEVEGRMVNSPDPSMYQLFEPPQNQERGCSIFENSSSVRDPLEELLNKDFQKLSVNLKEKR